MIRAQFSLLLLLLLWGVDAFSIGNLENPAASANQSGVGIISGWYCNANTIEIVFDDLPPKAAAYGTNRPDTVGDCGDTNNGFGLLWAYSLLGEGTHRVRAYADGVEFADRTFAVGILGDGTFLWGVTGTFQLEDFPQDATITTVKWTESMQNFTIVESVELDPALRKWIASSPNDPTVNVSLTADDPSTYYGAAPPELVVECSGAAVGVTVHWNEQVSTISAYTSMTAVDNMFMFLTPDSVSSLSLVPAHMTSNLIDTLLQNDYMTISTLNVAGDRIYATYDLRGFDQAYLPVQTACI